MVSADKVVAQLCRDGPHPAAQRGGQLVRNKEGPSGQQSHDVHQGPANGQPIVPRFPPIGRLIKPTDLAPLYRAVRQTYANQRIDSLSLLQREEQSTFVPGLEPPVVVVNRQLQRPVWQG